LDQHIITQRERQEEYTSLRTAASNDGTLLYTNSLDALHHLRSRNNCLKASLKTADSKADCRKLACSISPVKVGLDLEQIAIVGFLALTCLLGPSDDHIKSLQRWTPGKWLICTNSRWPPSKA